MSLSSGRELGQKWRGNSHRFRTFYAATNRKKLSDPHYLPAIVAHFGHWVQPPRRQATGPAPKPRWMPLPALLCAQVVKTLRRRRLVEVKPRVVFGTKAEVEQVLVVCGWQINTAFVEVRPVGRKEALASG
jgi:hypothetical protein